ncbi:MAG: hypothetical protein MK106_08510 [Mariniblastus sp.]|nr:hypothetical protein [Mariniblastus sp.]
MSNLFQIRHLFVVLLASSGWLCPNELVGQSHFGLVPSLARNLTCFGVLAVQSTPTQLPPQIYPGQAVPPGSSVLPSLNATAAPQYSAPQYSAPQYTAPPFDPFQTQTPSFPMTFGNQSAPVQVLPPQQQFLNPNQSQFGQYNSAGFPPRWPETSWAWPAQNWAAFRSETNPREFFDRSRLRSTWLPGDGSGGQNYLSINTLDLATTMTFKPGPNSNPIRVSPGFSFNWWGGPQTPEINLPPRVYDAYIATDYCSNQCNRTGFEGDFTIGVFSDFKNMDSSAIRLEGVLLGWFRPNQTNTYKFGVEYLDRQKTKLLPAFGVFITPTPDFRFDLYFPRPRLAQKVRLNNGGEMWLYLGSEYGGGSWAVERSDVLGANLRDQVDVNDIRTFIGVEFTRASGRTSFFEFGYVSNRNIIMRSDVPTNKLDLRDTIMLRSGMAF